MNNEWLITTGYADVADKAELLRNRIKMHETTIARELKGIHEPYLKLDSALRAVNQEVRTNIANYQDLKDENRRLQDLVTMHEETQDRQLADNALLEKRYAALEAVICKASE